MVRNIIGGAIIFSGLTLFVLGNILFKHNCNEYTEAKDKAKIKNLKFEMLVQKERMCYIIGFLLIIIGVLTIIFV